jgi:alpha-1,6-mannosyltransferase
MAGSPSRTEAIEQAERRPVDRGPHKPASARLIALARSLRAEGSALSLERLSLAGLCLTALILEFALVRWWLGAFSIAGHPGFMAPGQDPLIWLLGDGDDGMSHFMRLLAVAFAPYFLGLALAGRARGRLAVGVALAGAAIFGATMLASFPGGALDIFHNIMDGRLTWLYHYNPLVVPPSAAYRDPLLSYLHYWADTRAAYGPLWFLVTLPAYLLGGNSLDRNIVAYKALPFAFELVSLLFIALIMRRIDPRRTAAAIVCFGWNPLVLWEIAGNGHNDIVMMCFVLAAILLLLGEHWPYAFPVLALSILVKFASLVLLPVFVLWVLIRYRARAVVPLISGLVGALLVALAVYSPFWAGAKTAEQLAVQQQHGIIFSPASALIGQWGEDLPNAPRAVAVKVALTAIFAVLYGVALLRLRASPFTLLRASVEIMFLLLVLMTWWFWPWYVVWGLALACLLPGTAHMRLFVIFSATAMLLYISSPWRQQLWNFTSPYPLALGTALLIFLPPVLYACVQFLGGPDRAVDESTLAQL